METRHKRVLIAVGIIVVLAFVLADPFQFVGTFLRRKRAAVPPGTLEDLTAYARTRTTPPAEYVIDSFRDADIVFLGEFPQIAEHVNFMSSLIPKLYRAGIQNLGTEYALSRDQKRIDALLTAPTYDNREAQRLLFDRLPIWGYQEYADLFRAAWEFNRELPETSAPFRIVGLSAPVSYHYIKEADDVKKPEVVHKVFENGIPDVHMAAVIRTQFVDPGVKAVVYTAVSHAFTAFRDVSYERQMKALGFTKTRRAGNIIYDDIGKRAITIYLHAPWPRKEGRNGLTFPLEGVPGAVIDRLPQSARSFGFDVADSPFGTFPVRSADYTQGYDSLLFQDLADGYVVLEPIYDLHAAAPIANFISEENLERAIRGFPEPLPSGVTAERLNSYISRVSTNLNKILAGF